VIVSFCTIESDTQYSHAILRPRDFIIVAAVVLIGGFAAADTLRGRGDREETSSPETTAVQTGPTRLPGPAPQPDPPEGWPVGALEGSLVFTNAEDCRLRVIGLAGGRERPLARFSSDCDLWAPPVGERIAYGLGPASADGFTPFKLADLSRPNADLGGFRALFGVVLWSPDGQRVAWCGRRRTGYDLEVSGPVRRLPTCPVTYTPSGEIAYAVGNRLSTDTRTLARVDGGITFATFAGRRLIVVVDGKEIQIFEGGVPKWAADLPPALQGRTPIVSPDGCSAAFRPFDAPGDVQVRDLGCTGRAPQAFFGSDAAWSPDGEWLAVAERQTIAFHHLARVDETIRWPAAAASLAWRAR
jgi:WD40-like Beta Propeller Repeat